MPSFLAGRFPSSTSPPLSRCSCRCPSEHTPAYRIRLLVAGRRSMPVRPPIRIGSQEAPTTATERGMKQSVGPGAWHGDPRPVPAGGLTPGFVHRAGERGRCSPTLRAGPGRFCSTAFSATSDGVTPSGNPGRRWRRSVPHPSPQAGPDRGNATSPAVRCGCESTRTATADAVARRFRTAQSRAPRPAPETGGGHGKRVGAGRMTRRPIHRCRRRREVRR